MTGKRLNIWANVPILWSEYRNRHFTYALIGFCNLLLVAHLYRVLIIYLIYFSKIQKLIKYRVDYSLSSKKLIYYLVNVLMKDSFAMIIL